MKTNLWILSTGTELTRGYSRDTNSSEISQRIVNEGYEVLGISILPDNPSILESQIQELTAKKEIKGIIMTGGLGPTDDDHTIDVLAKIFNKRIIEDDYALNKLITLQERLKKITIESARRQVRILESAIRIQNEVGLAPGMIIEFEKDSQNKFIACLPGVPMEMRSMLPEVIEYLKKNFPVSRFYQKKNFYIYLEPESEFQKIYHKLVNDIQFYFPWGISAIPGYLKVFIENHNEEQKDKFEKIIEMIKNFYKEKFINNLINEELHKLLIEKQKKIAFAESCTGGMLGKLITDIPDSSKYFLGSFVVYSNDLKTRILGVQEEILNQKGSVSRECAEAMLKGVFQLTNADYSLSVTGIAGPSGGTKEKPVGTVYIGTGSKNDLEIKKIFYPATRERIREYTSNVSLFFLYSYIKRDFTS